jgi:hypothetical protein
MSKAIEFIDVMRLYMRHHSIVYSARIAYGIVFKQLPF